MPYTARRSGHTDTVDRQADSVLFCPSWTSSLFVLQTNVINCKRYQLYVHLNRSFIRTVQSIAATASCDDDDNEDDYGDDDDDEEE